MFQYFFYLFLCKILPPGVAPSHPWGSLFEKKTWIYTTWGCFRIPDKLQHSLSNVLKKKILFSPTLAHHCSPILLLGIMIWTNLASKDASTQDSAFMANWFMRSYWKNTNFFSKFLINSLLKKGCGPSF